MINIMTNIDPVFRWNIKIPILVIIPIFFNFNMEDYKMFKYRIGQSLTGNCFLDLISFDFDRKVVKGQRSA